MTNQPTKKLCAIAMCLCSYYSISQEIIFQSGFENNLTPPISTSTPPCSSLPDLWDKTTQIGNFTPTEGTYFWGVRDLNGNCGSSNFESIEINNLDVSNFNYVTISFDYFFYEFDNGDDIKYQLNLDNLLASPNILVDGNSNLSSNGWIQENIIINDTVDLLSFTLFIKQNGDNDYAGFDNLRITGVHQDSCYIEKISPNNINCNNNATPSNALDDFLNCELTVSGQNTSNNFNLSINNTNSGNLPLNVSTQVASPTGSIMDSITYLISDLNQSTCTRTFNIDSLGHCSNNYNLHIDTTSFQYLEVNCNYGDSLDIDLTATGVFHSSNIFTIKLLDSLDQFIENLGVISNLSNAQTIPIPHGLDKNSAYKITCNSSFPVINSDTLILPIENQFSCTEPYINSIVVNACGGMSSEADGELIFGNMGSYACELTDSNFQFFYGNTHNLSISNLEIHEFIDKPINTQLLNSAASCNGLFIDAYNNIIPSNAKFMICRESININNIYWYNLCNNGPVYVLYSSDPTWLNNGLFSNSTQNGIRYMKINFTDTLNHLFTNEINYDRTQNSGIDGDYVVYNDKGGSPVNYDNNGCVLAAGVLPIELIEFSISNNYPSVEIKILFGDENRFLNYHIDKYENEMWLNERILEKSEFTMSPGNYELHSYNYKNQGVYRLVGNLYDGTQVVLAVESYKRNTKKKKIKARTNMLGQEIQPYYKGIHILIFEDNSTRVEVKN